MCTFIVGAVFLSPGLQNSFETFQFFIHSSKRYPDKLGRLWLQVLCYCFWLLGQISAFLHPVSTTLSPLPRTHTLCMHKCFSGHSLNLAKELIQLKKNPGKKKIKSQFIFCAGSVLCLGSLHGYEKCCAGRALGMT